MQSYGISTQVNQSFEDAVAKVTEELQKEGFGILTEINVRETLKKKLGVDCAEYVILGACNPPLAHRALQAEPEVGLLLPCNVIVYQNQEGKTVVSAVDPLAMLGIIDNAELSDVAKTVHEKMVRVIENVRK
jgi:uncharacterized protein (DUF302 family)